MYMICINKQNNYLSTGLSTLVKHFIFKWQGLEEVAVGEVSLDWIS